MRYKATILEGLIRAGNWGAAARAAWRMARSGRHTMHRPVYGLSVPSKFLAIFEHPHYVVQRAESPADLGVSFRQEVSRWAAADTFQLAPLFGAGGVLWIGRLDGQIANVGWTRTGDCVRTWFFPLADHWVVLSHFLTLPVSRGRGLYSCLMSHIVNRLAADGIDRFFIDCADWNLPSIRGIEKLGFRRLGCGISSRKGRLIWHPEWMPSAHGIISSPRASHR
jgi:RimJ/RimL family protein N-acetyltransferase